MKELEVSVIIPVYNASRFLVRSVESALSQSEVVEVILIEDGSKDGSLSICHEIVGKYSKVKLYTHEKNENKGAGESRNLGLSKASCEWIAFLDADDQFLENRFKYAWEALAKDPDADGFYEPVECEFTSDKARIDFSKLINVSVDSVDKHLSYPVLKLKGKDFFRSLILESNGFPHTDGILVKKQLFEKAGIFNTELRLHQDSDMWIRLAYYGQFTTPEVTIPVARRTQHEENRITHRNYASMLKFYQSVYSWGNKVGIENYLLKKIRQRIAYLETNIQMPESPFIKVVWRLRYLISLLKS